MEDKNSHVNILLIAISSADRSVRACLCLPFGCTKFGLTILLHADYLRLTDYKQKNNPNSIGLCSVFDCLV